MRHLTVSLIMLGLVGCSSTKMVAIPPPESSFQSVASSAPVAASDAVTQAIVQPIDERERLRAAGVMVLEHEPGKVVYLLTKVDFPTTISFQAGEKIISSQETHAKEQKAGEEGPEWTIVIGYSGSGDTMRHHLEVTPHKLKLHTGFVVATTRGLYHIDVRSTADSYTPAVMFWTEAATIKPLQAKALNSIVVTTGLIGVGYKARAPKGHIPIWARTMSAWDDRHRTYIQLDPAVRSYESPVVYVINDDGTEAVVNAAMDHPPNPATLVMDRLGDWKLKIGESYVEVRRIAGDQVITCPGSSACP